MSQKSSNQVLFRSYIHTNGDEKTNVAFKNCALFTWCVTHINDGHIDTARYLDTIMLMENLIEYSDNYPDTSGSL